MFHRANMEFQKKCAYLILLNALSCLLAMIPPARGSVTFVKDQG